MFDICFIYQTWLTSTYTCIQKKSFWAICPSIKESNDRPQDADSIMSTPEPRYFWYKISAGDTRTLVLHVQYTLVYRAVKSIQYRYKINWWNILNCVQVLVMCQDGKYSGKMHRYMYIIYGFFHVYITMITRARRVSPPSELWYGICWTGTYFTSCCGKDMTPYTVNSDGTPTRTFKFRLWKVYNWAGQTLHYYRWSLLLVYCIGLFTLFVF